MIDSVCRLPYWISPLLRPTRSSKAACSDYARAHQSVGGAQWTQACNLPPAKNYPFPPV